MSLADRGRSFKENGGRVKFEETDYVVVLKEVTLKKSRSGNDQFIFKHVIMEGPYEDKELTSQFTLVPKNIDFQTDRLCAIAIDLGAEKALEGLEDVLDLKKVFNKLLLHPAKCVVELKYQDNEKYYDLTYKEIDPVLEKVFGKSEKTEEPVEEKKESSKKEEGVKDPFS